MTKVFFVARGALTAVFAEDALPGKIKASPLGCMDNLRQNDWFGFWGDCVFTGSRYSSSYLGSDFTVPPSMALSWARRPTPVQ